MKNFITTNQVQILQLVFPSAVKEDNTLRAKFTLDVLNGKGVALSGGGLFKGEKYIGSFDGLGGFAHNVKGADKEGVEALLDNLSDALEREFGIEKPKKIEINENDKEGK